MTRGQLIRINDAAAASVSHVKKKSQGSRLQPWRALSPSLRRCCPSVHGVGNCARHTEAPGKDGIALEEIRPLSN